MSLLDTIKKHAPVVIGSVAGLATIYYIYKQRQNAAANPVASSGSIQYVPVASADQASASQSQNEAFDLQQQAQIASEALQSQQLTAQINATNQANQIAYTNAIGSTASTVANSVANIYTSEAQLPAAAIQAATAENQTALTSAAAVAAQGVASLPDYLNAAANLTAASYLPIATYGNAMGKITGTVATASASTLGATGTSGTSAAQSAAASAGSAANANASSSATTGETLATVGTIAAIAAL